MIRLGTDRYTLSASWRRGVSNVVRNRTATPYSIHRLANGKWQVEHEASGRIGPTFGQRQEALHEVIGWIVRPRECDCCGEVKTELRFVRVPTRGDAVICEECSR